MTDYEGNRSMVLNFIVKHRDRILKVELIKEHNLGISKYRSLGMTELDYLGAEDKLMDET